MVRGGLLTPTAWLGNVYVAGDRVTSPPLPPVAVPESVSVCEPVGYVTVTDPVLAPTVKGENST